MSEQLRASNNKIFDTSEIPVVGYELGKVETIDLKLSGASEDTADGIVTDQGRKSLYKTIAQLRLGGNETYEDIDVITISAPKEGQYGKTGIPALLRHGSEGAAVIYYGQLVSSGKKEGVIGRGCKLFEDLPDTVSRQHVSIEWDRDAGTLAVHNLNPTNDTILFPPEDLGERGLQSPDELEVGIALDPGETNNGQSIEGYLQESAAAREAREKQLARARRRRRLATQTMQRTLTMK